MKWLILTSFLLTLSLSAADLTGKWEGSYNLTAPDGQTLNGKVVLILTQTGNALTGTVGPDEQEQTRIAKGAVQGDKMTFESQTEGPLMKFDLRLEEDHIRGEAKGDADGHPIVVKLDLARSATGGIAAQRVCVYDRKRIGALRTPQSCGSG